jgi:hypothetical protein
MEVVSTTTTTDPVNMYDYLNNFILNPMIFVIILLIIIIYYVFSSSLGLGNSGFSISNSGSNLNSGSGTSIITTIIIIVLILLILVNAFQYFFSINLTAYIKGLFTPNTEVDIVVDNTTSATETETGSEARDSSETDSSLFSKLKLKKEVFNIPGNYYTYENAKALCQAYDADLASYDQIENAYNNGAEWCNYGWSSNQMALFPTQKQTYNTLQTIPGHENDCGRPGINGGYMANPRIRFGVNCYGYKPSITEKEEKLMETSTPYPETREDKIFQRKVDFWKDKIDEILVSPFNHNIWSSVSL